jgi:hypothetical protein
VIVITSKASSDKKGSKM